MQLRFETCAGEFAIVRCAPDLPVPDLAGSTTFLAAVRTTAELSLVCAAADVPAAAQHCSRGWRLIRLLGPFDLSLTGVLLQVLTPLADAQVPVFAISTFDTDYVLVPAAQLETACAALNAAGHRQIAAAAGTPHD